MSMLKGKLLLGYSHLIKEPFYIIYLNAEWELQPAAGMERHVWAHQRWSRLRSRICFWWRV